MKTQDEGEGKAPESTQPPKRPTYEAPRVLKKRSVARVTLCSAGGTSVGGLPAGG